MAPPLRPDFAITAADGHGQGHEGGPAGPRPWACDDVVWWRPLGSSDIRFTLLTDDDRKALAAGLAENGRPPVGKEP